MDLSLAKNLEFLVERTQFITGATGAAVALLESPGLICRACSGFTAPPLGATLQTNKSLSGECLRSGQLLRCDSVETDPRVDVEGCRALSIESILALPLQRQGHKIGLFELFSTQPFAFEERDTNALQRMARTVERALEGDVVWNEKQPCSRGGLYPVRKKRRFPRYEIAVPLTVNALKSGVTDAIPGRCKNLGQGGMAAVLTEELTPGDIVVVEFSLPLVSSAMRVRAQVRTQERLQHGLEFLIPHLEGPTRVG